jgi:signal transduction histidine kinase
LGNTLRERLIALCDAQYGAVALVGIVFVLGLMLLAAAADPAASGSVATLLNFAAPAVALPAFVGMILERRRRKSLEVAAHASEERARWANAQFVDAISSMTDEFQLWDKDERLVAYSPQTFAGRDRPRLGVTYGEFLERLAFSGRYPDVAGREREFIAAALHRFRARQHLQVEHRRAQGQWISVRWVPSSDGGAMAIISDITERKNAEAALRASEEKARQAHDRLLDAVDSLQDGFVLWDKHGRLALYNQAIFGRIYSPAWKPPLGIHFEAYLTELTARGEILKADDSEKKYLQESLQGFDDSVPAPVEFRLRDGRWILAHRRRTSDGGMVGILTDITPLKIAQLRAEAIASDLAEKRQQLDTAIEHMVQGLAFYDADQRLVLCNRQYREMFHLPAEVARPGARLSDILEYSMRVRNYAPQERQQLIETRLALAACGEHHQRWMRLADGRVIDSTYEPLPGGGSIGTFRDVTERERATAAVIAAKNAAEAANEAKSRFLAQMSHELRTPLNAVLGFSEIIRDRRFGDAALDRYADYAAEINRSGERLLHTLNDVLYMAQRQGAEPLPLKDDVVELAEEIAHVQSNVADTALQRNIRVFAQVPPDLPRLRADRSLLSQLLHNLISNAIKFTPAGGSVNLTAGVQPGGGVWMRVADTGVGIAAADRDRLFEPFFQIGTPPGRAREGIGLGLPICKDIAELHGGSIRIDSHPGRGTKATVIFPAGRAIARREPERGAAGAES